MPLFQLDDGLVDAIGLGAIPSCAVEDWVAGALLRSSHVDGADGVGG